MGRKAFSLSWVAVPILSLFAASTLAAGQERCCTTSATTTALTAPIRARRDLRWHRQSLWHDRRRRRCQPSSSPLRHDIQVVAHQGRRVDRDLAPHFGQGDDGVAQIVRWSSMLLAISTARLSIAGLPTPGRYSSCRPASTGNGQRRCCTGSPAVRTVRPPSVV